jgi:hypothetical protein
MHNIKRIITLLLVRQLNALYLSVLLPPGLQVHISNLKTVINIAYIASVLEVSFVGCGAR